MDSGVDADTRTHELRGVWITRFAFTTQTDLEAIIDRAAAAHFNAVFVQIRGEGDAYYASAFEPWAKRLTGVLGRDPGWDPLRVAIDRAHSHGMELHAYFNVFTAWNATQPLVAAEGSIEHALVAHPDWLAVDSSGMNKDTEYRWFAQGNPAVHAHIVAVARDLLQHYDVDGLHLDRIRTPGPDYSRDAATVAAYDAARTANTSLTWADFMRSQVSSMVAEIHNALVETRPKAKLSASVWGIYTPLPGCTTSQGYANYYQDSRGWLAAETIDAIAPMIYWSIEPGACTDWSALLDGFVAARADRHIWAGMHALDQSMWNWDQVRARIERSRAAGAQGSVVFASTYLDQDPTRWTQFIGSDGPYAELALPPEMSWK
ncbi:MAG TPA: family 10 glycosylhydrolase [Kofleriaceae bacterium]